MAEQDSTQEHSENSDEQNIQKRKGRNYMILALILGMVAIIWGITMVKMLAGFS